jgi:5-methylcytosine-specific restriction endonuclease McrA
MLASGRRYRRCAACHTPRTDRRPRAYYKTAAYKRERRERLALAAGRAFRGSGPGGRGPAPGDAKPVRPSVLAHRAWRHWLTIASGEWIARYRAARANARKRRKQEAFDQDPSGQRAAWRRARHKKRLGRQDQADGTLVREGFDELYQAARRCAYCACRLSIRRPGGWRKSDATLDHLVALSRGGIHGLVNVAIVCATCNFRKRDQEYAEWAMSLPADQRARALRLWFQRYGAPPEQGLLI